MLVLLELTLAKEQACCFSARKQIPKELKFCAQTFKSTILSSTSTVDSLFLVSLGQTLKGCRQLQELLLDIYDAYMVQDQGILALSEGLVHCRCLVRLTLDLSGLQLITNQSVDLLLASLNFLSSLQQLDLSFIGNSHLSPQFISKVQNQHLTHLTLKLNTFSRPALLALNLSHLLAQLDLHKLKLDLSCNQLQDEQLLSIMQNFPQSLEQVEVECSMNSGERPQNWIGPITKLPGLKCFKTGGQQDQWQKARKILQAAGIAFEFTD